MRTADIEIRRAATVNSAKVAHGNGRIRSFSSMDDSLRAEQYVSHILGSGATDARISERLRACQQFETGMNGNLHDLANASLRGNFRRSPRAKYAGLKLEIADGG